MSDPARETTTIQVHLRGQWRTAATIQALGSDRCRLEYLPEYVFGLSVERIANYIVVKVLFEIYRSFQIIFNIKRKFLF